MAGSDSARRMPSLPWTVSLQAAAYDIVHRLDGSVRRTLSSIADLKKSAQQTAASDDVRSADFTIDASLGISARVFSPSPASPAAAGAPPLPVVVFFHGGGFKLFSAASRPYDALCRRLCRGVGAVVVSVNYRLAPEHRFPAAYYDGVAALRYLDGAGGLPADVAPIPVDLSSVFLAGDSSGGNMVHHVAQRWAATSSSSSPPRRLRLAGAILIQPFFGGEERTAAEMEFDKACRILTVARADHYWKEFLPEGATRDHPAARVCGDGVEIAEAFPPAMVVVGGFDLLKDWHARYVETLRRKGKEVRVVEYPDAFHGFYAFPELADAGKLMEDVKLFVDDHRSGPLQQASNLITTT
ncbi:unnamed protein product [Urochloa humidicola]